MTEKVVIVGAGKTASLAAEIFRENGVEILGFFVEESFTKSTSRNLGGRVETIDRLEKCLLQNPGAGFFVAVGYQNLNQERRRLTSMAIGTAAPPVSCISQHARISETAVIEPGVLVGPFVDVQLGTLVEEGTFLWSNVTVGHGSHIEKFCWVAAGSTIGGDARIGARSFLGLNSVVGHNVAVGQGCLIGSGVSLTRDLEPEAAAMSSATHMFSRGAQRLSRVSGL